MGHFIEGVVEGILDGNRAVYNPVLFYGDPSETGAVIARLIRDYRVMHPFRKVLQISGEEFFGKLVLSVKDGTSLDFGNQFDHTDLLVFENVDDIAGKTVTMQIFYGVFDKVYESGGQIVLTSSAPPVKLYLMEDRIRTQIEGGIICDVHA